MSNMLYVYDATIYTDYYNKKRVILYAFSDNNELIEHTLILSDPAMTSYDIMSEIYDVVGGGAIVAIQEDVDAVLTPTGDKYMVDYMTGYREASEEEISAILTKIQEGWYGDYYVKPIKFKLGDVVGKYTSTTANLLDLRLQIDGKMARVRIIQTIAKSYSSVLSKLSYIYTDLLNMLHKKGYIPNKVEDILSAILSTQTFAITSLVVPGRSVKSPAISMFRCEAMWIYMKPLEHLFQELENHVEMDRQLARLVSTYRSIVSRQRNIKILDEMLKNSTAREEKKEVKIE